MSKDNITYPSLITLSKSFESDITNDIVDNSIISNELTFSSAIGIEDVVPLYVPEYQAVYDAFTIKPSDIIATAQNAMVEGMVNTGVWLKKDVFYVFAAHTNDNGEALINWKNPGTHNATLVNNPAFVAFEGFTGDGSTQYIDSNYNPNTQGVNYQLNSSALGIYSRINVSDSGVDIGCKDISNFSLLYIRLTNFMQARINCVSPNTVSNLNSLGLFFGVRENSNSTSLYKNTTLLQNLAIASVNIPNLNFWIMCYNNIGVATNLSAKQYSYASIGGGLTQQNVNDETDYFEAYMDSNGRGVIA